MSTSFVRSLMFLMISIIGSQNMLIAQESHHRVAPMVASFGQGTNINVIYHRCNWRIHPDSPSTTLPVKYLRGNVTTHFLTTQANVASITFDFNSVFTIDSILYRKSKLPTTNYVWSTTKILQINFPSIIANSGTKDSVTIFYRGIPPAASGQALGYQKAGTSSNNYVYTLSESYEDRDWWPCKHDMRDKIDSMDINISVPSTFWAAANGKMVDTSVVGTNRIMRFQHRYPIASYLVAIGVAKYVRYYRTPVNIGGVNVPVVYNVFSGKSSSATTTMLTALDKSRDELVAFSAKYGDYPFKNEKHGYYEFGFGGGMEHQTFSGMGGSALSAPDVIAHELAHQWFGDKVTCATWNDIWLNEGFARYNEVQAAQLVTGVGTPSSILSTLKSNARATSTTPIYITDASTSNTIWTTNNDNAIYERGGMVVSMLRTMLGDTKFFQACRNYLNDTALAYKSAATADLQRHMEGQFGASMNTFFNSWIYGAGTPSYTVGWYTTGNNISVKLTQTRTTGSTVSHFAMPVVLRIAGSGTNLTTITLYDRGDSIFVAGNGIGVGYAGRIANINLPFAPATVTFDPDNVTMATGTVSKSTTPLVRTAVAPMNNDITVYPNPVSNELLFIRNKVQDGTVLHFTDMAGNTILKMPAVQSIEKINVENWKPGAYVLQIFEQGKLTDTRKIVVRH